jgi:hypothetical protein
MSISATLIFTIVIFWVALALAAASLLAGQGA